MTDRRKPTPEEMERLQESFSGLALLVEPILGAAEAFARAVAPVATNIARSLAPIARALAPIGKILVELALHHRQCEMLDGAGWLPHSTSPFQLLEQNAFWTPDEVREHVAAYYAENWATVSARLLHELDETAVDDEAKLVFREAVAAHEAGLYRVAPRLLFPELERVSRGTLHRNDELPRGIASQQKLQSISEDLIPASFEGLRFRQRLIQHLYEHSRQPDQVARYAADPVPNRHASLHGLVVYSTPQTSLNAMILALYIFQMLSVYLEQGDNQAGVHLQRLLATQNVKRD